MTYFNYKGILQESLTLKISVQKYSERFANRNYTAELQQEFANQISNTNNLSIQYQDAIDRKEVATAELRDFIKETQNDLKIVRTAEKMFLRGGVWNYATWVSVKNRLPQLTGSAARRRES